MTVADAWMAGRDHLVALGIDEAGITAEVLLRHALDLSRTDLYLAWDRPIEAGAWARYQSLLAERAGGRPVAYITGRREFMGLDFLVDERVLIPRPETEVLVETVLDILRGRASPVVADIGTGTGAIAVSLAVLRPDADVLATDLSADALDVARANAARHGVADRIRFLQGDLLDPLIDAGHRIDVIACNPPYVSLDAAAALPREIRDFEPSLAVVASGGVQTVYARLAEEAPRALRAGGWLVVEVGAGQAPRVVELLKRTGLYEPAQLRRDGLGWDRVVAARLGAGVASEGIGVSYYQLTFETAVRRQPKPVTIIRVNPDEAQPPRKAVEVLRSGGLIVFPTEEGYMVGCNALDLTAVQRLRQVTGAASEHLVRFAASREQAGRLTGLARPLTHPCPLALMRAADLPMAAAAVPPGGSPAPTAQHVVFILGDAVDLVLDAGPIRRQPVAGGR